MFRQVIRLLAEIFHVKVSLIATDSIVAGSIAIALVLIGLVVTDAVVVF
jgi:hypothetical protein